MVTRGIFDVNYKSFLDVIRFCLQIISHLYLKCFKGISAYNYITFLNDFPDPANHRGCQSHFIHKSIKLFHYFLLYRAAIRLKVYPIFFSFRAIKPFLEVRTRK